MPRNESSACTTSTCLLYTSGTGKTLIMCVAAYEMHRLGLARKPMIIGIKANIHEIARTLSLIHI